MTSTQPKPTIADAFKQADVNALASVYYGICDRINDHGHALANLVVAPADAEGTPDWEHAHPTNLEPPSSDSDPADIAEVKRWAILVDDISGCDDETSMLIWLDAATGQPNMAQIEGPAPDGDIAMRILGRDIGAAPPLREYSPSALAKSLDSFLGGDAKERTPANDNNPSGAPSTLTFLNPAAWHGKPVPVREWYADGLIPNRQVTILNGDGGVGKSLLALQIAAAGALSDDTLDMSPAAGKTLYVGAEDEADEFHRRLIDIATASGKDLSDLSLFRLLPLADRDALLAVPDKTGNMRATPLLSQVIKFACEFQPRLIVFDTAADLFGGDEIKRGQVRQFIAMLRQVAIGIECAVVLLAHPSVEGIKSGTGSSGSTAWSNSVRSRLYLTKPKDDEADPDLRVLKTMKSNYGKVGDEIRLRWKDGAFVLDDGKSPVGSVLVAAKAERVFCDLLSMFNRTGQNCSDVTGTSYAPAKMAKHPDAQGVSKKSLADAMQRLIDRGEVRIVMDGPPSRQRKRLILASEDFGPQET